MLFNISRDKPDAMYIIFLILDIRSYEAVGFQCHNLGFFQGICMDCIFLRMFCFYIDNIGIHSNPPVYRSDKYGAADVCPYERERKNTERTAFANKKITAKETGKGDHPSFMMSTVYGQNLCASVKYMTGARKNGDEL
jgi:hypothetical protein